MPTVLRVGRYRFFFYSNEGDESVHIHVTDGKGDAKIWIFPRVKIAKNHGFSDRVMHKIACIAVEHQEEIVRKWNEYFKHH